MRRLALRRAQAAPLALALTAAAALAGALASRAARAQAPAPSDPSGPYASAETCAACHQTIHTYWTESAHARSASAPPYRAALSEAVKDAVDANAARRGCVWCHAPTSLVTGDYALAQPISNEGVTCDFCHTVADVDLDKAGHPFELKPGDVKRGPLQYAESNFHATEYSVLHKSSPLLCAACHEYTNAAGAPVLSTWSEWKESPYAARGVPCQECHMPLVPGTTVREGLPSSQRAINLHRLVGGSVPSKVRSGLDLHLEVSRSSVAADVRVVVTNTAVGHAAPGGLSTKTLVLAVGVETAGGKLLHRRERTFRRELKDARGQALSSVADLFLKAASVGEDTRLKPKESRTERFTVPLSDDSRAIVARLEYRDASDPKAVPKTTLITEERYQLRGR